MQLLKQLIPQNSFIRKTYSWIKAIIASLIYKNPSKNLYVIGVTGTDGKTTTVHFIAQLLSFLGMKVAMSSTEEIWINDLKSINKTKRTTLSPFLVQKFLHQAHQKTCEVAVIEVSSHALSQGRVFGVEFDIAVVTNISQEHCDYHHDLHDYANVKANLCRLVRRSPKQKKMIILNQSMEFFDVFAKIAPDHNLTFCLENDQANLTARNLIGNSEKTCFILDNQTQKANVCVHIPGIYNVENILAASLVAQYFDFSLQDISTKLPFLKPISGRLEKIQLHKNFNVFIDFAVTPGALEKLLIYAQSITNNKVIVVFGCTGGNHDQEKRPLMGEISAKIADYVVLTEDETYGEDNEKIVQDIQKGFTDNFTNYQVIHDRKKAIYFALQKAQAGDIVLVTGMGAFQSRNNGQGEEKWSDKKIIEEYDKLG